MPKNEITNDNKELTSFYFENKLNNKQHKINNETISCKLHSFILFNENNTILNKFIICLSLQENVRSSLRTRRKYSQIYHAVQGLQVILVCLVIFGNVFFLIMPYLGKLNYLKLIIKI